MHIKTASVVGLEGFPVAVEADVSSGLPAFSIVGLPDTAVQEARERVRAAIKNSRLRFPDSHITVNLAPADLKKEGPAFDLPIALAILAATKQIPAPYKDSMFIGELALDGSLRPVSGVLSVALLAKRQNYNNFFVPSDNAAEAGLVPLENMFSCFSLKEICDHLKKIKEMAPHQKQKTIYSEQKTTYDFSHIKGQEQAKRALVIAASGGHNVLLSGPPGSGKTMLARALPSILPRLTDEEMLQVTQIYSVAGLLANSSALITAPPFRSPHHSASAVSIIGGGSYPRPGEISLAHRGVLFLDEFPEFERRVLESLRQPLEDKVVFVARAQMSLTFPANFILLASQNPCPCGYASDPVHTCTCSPQQLLKYEKKISGPLLDRIDMRVEVPRVPIEKLREEDNEKSNTAVIEIQNQVENCRAIQRARLSKYGLFTNSDIQGKFIRQFCPLETQAENLLTKACEKYSLSARSYFRVIKLARTIADLAESEVIKNEHIAEALQFRQVATSVFSTLV